MRDQVLQSRLKRQQGRSSDVASSPSGRSLSPWEQDVKSGAEEGIDDRNGDQHLAPIVVELRGHEGSPERSQSTESLHQTKTFAQLQQILIRNELVGAAAERARVRAENS